MAELFIACRTDLDLKNEGIAEFASVYPGKIDAYCTERENLGKNYIVVSIPNLENNDAIKIGALITSAFENHDNTVTFVSKTEEGLNGVKAAIAYTKDEELRIIKDTHPCNYRGFPSFQLIFTDSQVQTSKIIEVDNYD